MTTHAQAKYKCDCLHQHGHIYNPHCRQCWEQQILQAKREGLEEAAKIVEGPWEDGWGQPIHAVYEITKAIRQRAKEVT